MRARASEPSTTSHLVLDFENVDEASVRYLRRLVFEIPGPGCAVMPINLNPLLRQRLADAQRCDARSGDLSNDLDC